MRRRGNSYSDGPHTSICEQGNQHGGAAFAAAHSFFLSQTRLIVLSVSQEVAYHKAARGEHMHSLLNHQCRRQYRKQTCLAHLEHWQN